MIKLFKTYFQKSKVFLYPLLGISKGSRYIPKETYMSWKNLYAFEDMKLLCLYDEKTTESYLRFERTKLLSNADFHDYHKLETGEHLYVFDLINYPQSYLAITHGLYSKMHEREKKKILDFFGDKSVIGQTVESYLYPEYFHADYSELLNVSAALIEDVYEVCDRPNEEKETLEKKSKHTPIIKNKRISLPNKL